jgi:hypothetical protein
MSIICLALDAEILRHENASDEIQDRVGKGNVDKHVQAVEGHPYQQNEGNGLAPQSRRHKAGGQRRSVP